MGNFADLPEVILPPGAKAWVDGVDEEAAPRSYVDSLAIPDASRAILELAAADGWTAVYDVTNPTTRTLVDDRVAEITDGLGNLPAIQQSTAASRPDYLPGEFGALAGMDSGDDGRYLQSAEFAAPLAQPNFVAVVGRSRSLVQAARFVLDGAGAAAERHAILQRNQPGNPFGAFDGAERTIAVSDTAPHIFGVLFDGVNEFWVDGQRVKSESAGSSPLNGVTLGADRVGGRTWRGSFGLALIRDTAPTRAQLRRMFALLELLTGIERGPLPLVAARAQSRSPNVVTLSKDPDSTQAPASTIKAMTAYAMRQHIGDAALDDVLTLTADDWGATSFGLPLQDGDQISWRDLLYGALLPSANDCADAIASHVGRILLDDGSAAGTTARAAFFAEMEGLAEAFGWEGFQALNASGTHNGSRMSAAMLTELMREISDGDSVLTGIMGTLEHTITVTGPNARTVDVDHTIDPDGAVGLPEFVAGKTGSTAVAGACLVLLWDHTDGTRHVSALMGSTTAERFRDVRKIMDETLA